MGTAPSPRLIRWLKHREMRCNQPVGQPRLQLGAAELFDDPDLLEDLKEQTWGQSCMHVSVLPLVASAGCAGCWDHNRAVPAFEPYDPAGASSLCASRIHRVHFRVLLQGLTDRMQRQPHPRRCEVQPQPPAPRLNMVQAGVSRASSAPRIGGRAEHDLAVDLDALLESRDHQGRPAHRGSGVPAIIRLSRNAPPRSMPSGDALISALPMRIRSTLSFIVRGVIVSIIQASNDNS